jgi:cyclophilin family peptidyl-prolyl cis-trans isomerase
MKRCLIAFLVLGCATEPAAQAKNPVVVIKTNKGTIKVELDEGKAPITVKNFLKYVDNKHYDDTLFHRVIENFMIQGGGYTKDLYKATDRASTEKAEKKTGDPIKNESGNGLLNKKYAIAMARTMALDSATAQFFINTVDNGFLDKGKYAVFGRVIEGSGVVDKIKAVKTRELANGMENVPDEPVVIESIRRQP